MRKCMYECIIIIDVHSYGQRVLSLLSFPLVWLKEKTRTSFIHPIQSYLEFFQNFLLPSTSFPFNVNQYMNVPCCVQYVFLPANQHTQYSQERKRCAYFLCRRRLYYQHHKDNLVYLGTEKTQNYQQFSFNGRYTSQCGWFLGSVRLVPSPKTHPLNELMAPNNDFWNFFENCVVKACVYFA